MSAKFKNFSYSLLTNNITSTQTTFEVNDSSVFPNISGEEDYFVGILAYKSDIEIIKVNNISGNTLTVTRGHEGSTAKVFPSNSKLTNKLTAGELNFGGTVNIRDTSSIDKDYYPVFSEVTTGQAADIDVSPVKLTFNPYEGMLSATYFNSLSDLELKENIETLELDLEKFSNLNSVKFNWKDTKSQSFGLIAQELEELYPELVYTSSDGIKSIRYNGLIIILIKVVQHLLNKDK